MNNMNLSAFIQDEPFYIKQLPRKEKLKLAIFEKAVSHMYTDSVYTEKEITLALKEIYPDPVELRRYLIDYHFLTRTMDGSEYRFTKQHDE